MAEEKKDIVRVDHKNIFSALAAFQGENPVLEKTKEFGKATDKMHFWYCPLDEMLRVVRPLTSKHGIAIVFEESKDMPGAIVCALYHETYSKTGEVEANVIRSMPIKTKRDGDMKAIGGESTYASRYTMKEVLGLAPDEDKDVELSEARAEKVEKFAMTQARQGVENETLEKLPAKLKFLQEELAETKAGKPGKIGLSADQYIELIALTEERIKVLTAENVPA